MYPRPVEVKHLGDYRVSVAFEDGVRAELDFRPMTEWGGIFESLKNPAQFSQVRVDPDAESLVWPGGIDICPDVLYHLATGAALPGPVPRRAGEMVRTSRMFDRIGAD